MTNTQLQLRRGTSVAHTTFTGANGEITVDYTSKTIRVHDAVRAGGFEVVNRELAQSMNNKTLVGQANVSANAYFTGANVHFASDSVQLGGIANLHITGGSAGQQLQTDGSGTLSWASNTTISIDSVSNTHLTQGAVGPYELANNAVSNTHLQQGAVNSYELANSAVEPSKIATGAVTAGKIATGGVSANTQLAQAVVGSYSLANNAVAVTHLQANSIIQSKIANNAIDLEEINHSWSLLSTTANAIKNKRYCANTTSAGFTVTMPTAPLDGDTVQFHDSSGTWNTNNLTVSGAGGKNINGASTFLGDVNNGGFILTYITVTGQWRAITT